MKPRYTKKRLVLLFTLAIVSGYLWYIRTNLIVHSQTCFTQTSIASDSRCLYVYNNRVYEKGSRSSPHQNHPCGMDVTSIIPATHQADVVFYLDPNYRGNICAPATNTPKPTTPPTPTPQPASTSAPTSAPVNSGSTGPTSGASTPARTATPRPTRVPGSPSPNNLPTSGTTTATHVITYIVIALALSGCVLLIV